MNNEEMTPMENQKAPEKQSGKVGKIVNIVVNVLLVVAMLLAFVCTYTSFVTKKGNGVPSIFGYAPFSIQTDSMTGFFEEGDLVISKMVKDTSTLKEQDVITFWTIINGQRVLNTHRIVGIEDMGSYVSFTTQGDKYDTPDTMAVHESEVVGVYQTHIKGLGSVLDFLQTGTGFFLIVVLPVLLFFLYYAVEFFRALFAYQAGKTREKMAADAVASSGVGNITLTEEELQRVLAKALQEMNKQSAEATEQTSDVASNTQE